MPSGGLQYAKFRLYSWSVTEFCTKFAGVNEQAITRTCPRCGKVIAVSHEELTAHEGSIVCPQCLLLFTDNEVAAAARQARQALEAAKQAASQTATASYNYCPHCGQSIPHGINFCPYCGGRLSLPSAQATPQPAVAAEAVGNAPEPLDSDSQTPPVNDKGIQVLPYTFSPWLRTLKTPLPRPSVRFVIAACVVIAVELTWLATMLTLVARL